MTTKILLKLNDLTSLCIHKKSGITFIKDGYRGETFISHHPSIDSSGSVIGMKNLKYWGKNDLIIRNVCGQSVNISRSDCSHSGVKSYITKITCCCSECINASNSKAEKNFLKIIYENFDSVKICPMCYNIESVDEKYSFLNGFKLSVNEAMAIAALKTKTLNGTTPIDIMKFAHKESSVCADCREKIDKKLINRKEALKEEDENTFIEAISLIESLPDGACAENVESAAGNEKETINDIIEKVRAAGAVHYLDFKEKYYESRNLIIFTVNRYSSCINLAYYINEDKYYVIIDPFVDLSDSNTTSHAFIDLTNAMSCINVLCMFHQNIISVITK